MACLLEFFCVTRGCWNAVGGCYVWFWTFVLVVLSIRSTKLLYNLNITVDVFLNVLHEKHEENNRFLVITAAMTRYY